MKNDDFCKKELPELENTTSLFTYPEKKPLFENDRRKIQSSPLFPQSKLVLSWERDEKDYLIQVVFPLQANWDYNHYIVFLYDWDKSHLFMLVYRSHTVYPPVWDRSFSPGPDYLDYVSIQKYLMPIIKKEGLKPFEIDESYEGKSWNGTKENPDEIKKLLLEGKPYSILSLKMEAARHLKVKSVEVGG